MSDRDPRYEDEMMRFLLSRENPGETTPGPCPDPGTLAAFTERRSSESEREELEPHLARCEACRGVVVALVREVPDLQAAPRPRSRRIRPGHLAAAALILAAAVGGAFLLAGSGDRPRDDAVLLADHAGKLGIDLLSPEELAAGRPPVTRGDLRLFHPRGSVLDLRPSFEWVRVPGAGIYRVTLFGPDGSPIWTRQTDEARLGYPDGEATLVPGTHYLWSVEADSPAGSASARQAFRAAGEEERAEFRSLVESISSEAPERLREILIAHAAIRRDHLARAEASARARLRTDPANERARAILRHVRKRVGDPDADWWPPLEENE